MADGTGRIEGSRSHETYSITHTEGAKDDATKLAPSVSKVSSYAFKTAAGQFSVDFSSHAARNDYTRDGLSKPTREVQVTLPRTPTV